jgi:CRP-like cAMP-binding protein
LCGALMRGASCRAAGQLSNMRQSSYIAAADEVIYGKDATPDDIFAVCQGWALRYVELTDGRRQNLGVLLAGDLAPTALFQAKLHFSVAAVTELRITLFPRADVKKRLLGGPDLVELLGKTFAAQQRESDQRALAQSSQRRAGWHRPISDFRAGANIYRRLP